MKLRVLKIQIIGNVGMNDEQMLEKAWNDAIAPFCKEKQKKVPIRQNHFTTPYEKEQII